VEIVSDAGPPLLSYPGARIVEKVVEAGHQVVPVPGPSALLAALVGSGFDPEPFTFFGFTPRSGKGRSERLAEIAALGHVSVVYEAPGRLPRLLEELAEHCGAERRVVVARELTKVYETFFRGTLAEGIAYYEERPARGEVVVVIAGAADGAEEPVSVEAVLAVARTLLSEGQRPSAVARELSRRLGLSRNRAYEIVHSLGEEDEGDRG
jgi:16S rRNA (cytidine1402-2'-O)-methyltransferase